jgi:osmoprotectant transport system permease protein
MTRSVVFILGMLIAGASAVAEESLRIQVGSKGFTESVILADVATQCIQQTGTAVEHRRQLGGTRVLWNALVRGELDVYPEYTGTIAQEILADPNLRDVDQIRPALARQGIAMTQSLGFNDTYAIGMREERAGSLGIRRISDLKQRAELRFGFSNEFMDRKDGWPGLRDAYQLPQRAVSGMDHDLAYRALQSGDIDAVDLYSTDAEIRYYHLRVLEDDRRYFPDYQAVYLYRADLAQRAPQVLTALRRLEGRIDQGTMVELNSRVKLEHVPENRVAADFLAQTLAMATTVTTQTWIGEVIRRTKEHLVLVSISLLAAIMLAVPLGVIAGKCARVGQVILAVVAAIYTIPSLALLVFMIPLLGIGARPAIVALFLYSLLPIVRNTHEGLRDIPQPFRESAEALGLPGWARLLWIELPMASGSILAGIKTAAVINVGTATLGALIGAGGYGQPILTGIRLDNVGLILEGAVPAAALALAVQGVFELAEYIVLPRGLRAR